MRMLTGRLDTGHFKTQTEAGRFGARDPLRWQREILIPGDGTFSNTLWFGIDGARGVARMVNQTDVDVRTLVALMGYLEGDEAVAVVLEAKFGEYRNSREWRPETPPGPVLGPGPRRPPGTLLGGDINDCSVEMSIGDCVAVASVLVVQHRIIMLRHPLSLEGLGRIEVVPEDGIAALFADT